MLFSDCVKNSDILYMFALDNNILIRYDMTTQKAKVIGSIPTEAYYSRRLVAKLIIYCDQILVVPCNASDIWLYDLNNNSWIDLGFEKKNIKFKFAAAFVYDDKAFMIGCKYNGIAVYDFYNRDLKYYKKLYDRWRQYNSIDIYCRDYMFMNRNIVLLPSCVTGEIAEINLDNMSFHIYNIGDGARRFESIAMIDDEYWITPRGKGDLVIWNGKDVNKTIPINMGEKSNVCHYCGIIKIDNNVYMYATDDAMSGYCDLSDNNFQWNNQHYIFFHKDKGYTIVQNDDEDIFVIFKSKIKKIQIGNIHIEGLILYHESMFYKLNHFIEEIMRKEEPRVY